MNLQENNPETAEVPKEKHPMFQVTKLSKYLAMLLFVAMPFIGGWIGYTHAPEKTIEVIRVVSEQSPLEVVSSADTGKEYKRSFLGGEIPYDWSELSVSETSVKKGGWPGLVNIAYSFAPGKISFGDGAWEQVDFYYLTDGAKEELTERASREEGVIVASSSLNGQSATVISYPLDNGEVTKNGAGGTTYIVEIPETSRINPTFPKYLMISKWARGSQSFEEEFQHYLETIEVSLESLHAGQRIGGMTLVEFSAFNPSFSEMSSENIRMVLKGPISVTGTYEHYNSEIGFSGYCMSEFSEESLTQLPYVPASLPFANEYGSPAGMFCFRNEQDVAKQLGEESRQITVLIDNYELKSYPSEVMDEADFVDLIE